MAGLEVKNLTVEITHREILKNINISFAEGKRTAIIGPNGSGKSTLLKVIAGLNPHHTGDVLLNGQNLYHFGKKKLAQKLAILPQGSKTPLDLTVAELVDYGRFPYRSWLHGSCTKEDHEAVCCAIEQTKLTPLRDRQVATLSGGERQRAWIAMALAQQPEILLLDEPTTYLDIAHQLEVMQIITELNRAYKMTVIMVLHDLNHARQYADEIAVIRDRNIFAKGAPSQVLSVSMLAEVFGVRADVFTNRSGLSVLSPIALVK